MSGLYDNEFSPTNVYGRALELIERYSNIRSGLVHLDVGCGYGSIASRIAQLGLIYVGVDIAGDGLKSLSDRGFESHYVDLSDEEHTLLQLTKVIAGRRLASITMLDTLEHLSSPLDVLKAIKELIADRSVPLVLSVPNVTHRENVAKMVTGRFEYTEDGLLDRTHIIHFSRDTLFRMTREAGLAQVESNDTEVPHPDRDLQLDPEFLGYEAAWFKSVSNLRQLASPDSLSYQFVRAYLAAPPRPDSWYIRPAEKKARPFLSIVMRTTGRELFPLRDVLNCLVGQTNQDFEVLLVGHNLDLERQVNVERVLETVPRAMLHRIRFLRTEGGNRTVPLNLGYAQAAGRYIVTLDDDDLVFGHYVSTFRQLADIYPGRLLRVRCTAQNARESSVRGGSPGAISTGPIRTEYPANFDFVNHLHDNFTPCMSVAYPREVFHVFNLKFDEDLSTAEDYDMMMRAYSLFGIAESPEITCIYRRWEGKASSSQIHSAEEWAQNHDRIKTKLDRMAVILCCGELAEIRRRTRVSVFVQQDSTTIGVPPGSEYRSLWERLSSRLKDFF